MRDQTGPVHRFILILFQYQYEKGTTWSVHSYSLSSCVQGVYVVYITSMKVESRRLPCKSLFTDPTLLKSHSGDVEVAGTSRCCLTMRVKRGNSWTSFFHHIFHTIHLYVLLSVFLFKNWWCRICFLYWCRIVTNSKISSSRRFTSSCRRATADFRYVFPIPNGRRRRRRRGKRRRRPRKIRMKLGTFYPHTHPGWECEKKYYNNCIPDFVTICWVKDIDLIEVSVLENRWRTSSPSNENSGVYSVNNPVYM